MKLYLVANSSLKETGIYNEFSPSYILLNFHDVSEAALKYANSSANSFLMDSGAFTMMSDPKKATNLNDYVSSYIDFLNKNNPDLYFELDIDAVVGLSAVESIRARLEAEVNKPIVPVWHKSRGKEYFIKMCKKYDYVAVGGLAIGVITKDDYKYLPWFVKTAHKHGSKIHGLGFCPTNVSRYGFDSVDVSSWLSPVRFGGGFDKFENGRIKHHKVNGKRQVHWIELARHQLSEWVKYQRYLDTL